MRVLSIAAAGCVILGFGAASAAEPTAKTSSEDFVKAIQSAPCDNGYPRDDHGDCYTVTDPDRGYSIAAPGLQRLERSANAPASAPSRVASIDRAPTPAAAPKALADLLITFKLGSAELTPEGKAQAAAFAAALRDPRVASTRFEIAGHTDISGTPERNEALSSARAEAVKTFLVAQGVDSARLASKGYGAALLAVPTSPQDPANRRVEARRLD